MKHSLTEALEVFCRWHEGECVDLWYELLGSLEACGPCRWCRRFSGVTTARSSRACEMALRLFGAGCTNRDGRAGPPDVGRVVPSQPLGRDAGVFLGGVCPLMIQEAGGREHPGQVGSPIESSAAWLFFKRP